MQVPTQQPADFEELTPLSSDEQDEIVGGLVFIPLVIAVGRMAVVAYARKATATATITAARATPAVVGAAPVVSNAIPTAAPNIGLAIERLRGRD